jgi:hypothetical protein
MRQMVWMSPRRYAVGVTKKGGPGRRPHAAPPKMFSTNIPRSLYERLDRLAKATGKPKSVHLEAALRAYLRGRTPRSTNK